MNELYPGSRAEIEFCGGTACWGRLAAYTHMAVVTFTTDFGTADPYAGIMKGIVLSLAPDAVLVDITHHVPRHDVAAGALALADAASFFPPGSIHVAVVDPGVGGRRADIVVQTGEGIFIGPDNGLLTVAAHPPRQAYRIESPSFRREPVSATFHGRDVFAVAAGRIAAGTAARAAGAPLADIVELERAEASPLLDDCRGRILHVDGFGNLVTSLTAEIVQGKWQMDSGDFSGVVCGGRTFSDVAAGEMVIYPGSSGRLEIAVRDGSAAAVTSMRTGATFGLRRRR
jgi:S-adenosylmethionine hydrolase